MSATGRLLIITPILLLLSTASYIITTTLPQLASMLNVEVSSAYALWCETPKEYRYKTMIGITSVTLKDYWEVTITLTNKGEISSKIQDIIINDKPLTEDVIVLTKKADSSIYDTLKVKIEPGESVKIVILITRMGGIFMHGKVIQVDIKLQTQHLTKMILLP